MNQQTVEKQIEELINKYKLQDKLSVEQIKKWVWEEEGDPMKASQEFQVKLINYFTDKAQDMAELNEIVQICSNAWNYFPHQSLGGKAPTEMYKR